MSLLGGNLVVFEDEAGLYSALQVADRKALYAKLDEVAAKLQWTHETLQANGATLHHLHMPNRQLAAKAASDSDSALDAWLQIYSRAGSHAYWMEDGDYLIFADLPQALADRAAAKLDTDLGDWLRHHQSYEPNATLLGITGKTRHAQRKIYYAYLAGLQSAADLLGQNVALASLPNAAQLDLPVEGALCRPAR